MEYFIQFRCDLFTKRKKREKNLLRNLHKMKAFWKNIYSRSRNSQPATQLHKMRERPSQEATTTVTNVVNRQRKEHKPFKF